MGFTKRQSSNSRPTKSGGGPSILSKLRSPADGGPPVISNWSEVDPDTWRLIAALADCGLGIVLGRVRTGTALSVTLLDDGAKETIYGTPDALKAKLADVMLLLDVPMPT